MRSTRRTRNNALGLGFAALTLVIAARAEVRAGSFSFPGSFQVDDDVPLFTVAAEKAPHPQDAEAGAIPLTLSGY
jgi:hypothetical protein